VAVAGWVEYVTMGGLSVGNALLLVLTSTAAAGDVSYRLGPGDVVQVEVLGTDIGGQYVLASEGVMSLPYCDSLRLGAKTIAEAESSIRACLLDGVVKDPQVTLRVLEFHSQRIEVTGAVARPGSVFLQGDTNLRSLLGMAGGAVAEKSNGAVIVVRGEERLSVPLQDLGGEGGSMRVQAGDVVTVEQGFVVLVDGVGVQKPGEVPYAEGMTAFQALLRAGGATQIANLQASYVLRGDEKISVNLRKIRNGKSADVELLPGDKLVVPESPF
jgi:polysaccharide export outer membrane protein